MVFSVGGDVELLEMIAGSGAATTSLPVLYKSISITDLGKFDLGNTPFVSFISWRFVRYDHLVICWLSRYAGGRRCPRCWSRRKGARSCLDGIKRWAGYRADHRGWVFVVFHGRYVESTGNSRKEKSKTISD